MKALPEMQKHYQLCQDRLNRILSQSTWRQGQQYAPNRRGKLSVWWKRIAGLVATLTENAVQSILAFLIMLLHPSLGY
jgi:hypothetical protein